MCVLHFTSDRGHGEEQVAPQSWKEPALCGLWAPAEKPAVSSQLPLSAFLELHLAELREFQLQQPFWGPARNLHHKRQRGQPSRALSGIVWQKIPYAGTPPRHPFLLCFCVFVYHSGNGNEKGSHSLFKEEIIFC